jgi:hypothetical protein
MLIIFCLILKFKFNKHLLYVSAQQAPDFPIL